MIEEALIVGVFASGVRMSIPILFAALGEKDKAFLWLERDVAERAARPAQYSVNPMWDDLRDDPRFADLVRRIETSKMD